MSREVRTGATAVLTAAVLTHKRLVVGVSPHMHPQVISLIKPFVTSLPIAGKPATGMGSVVAVDLLFVSFQ